MPKYVMKFYKAPEQGKKRARLVASVERICDNPSEAVAFAAVTLAKSQPETVNAVNRVTVEEVS